MKNKGLLNVLIGVVGYFVFTVVFIVVASLFKMSFSTSGSIALIRFIYLVVPVILGFILAKRSQTFLKTFFSVIIVIYLIQAAYSGICYQLRNSYLNLWQSNIQQAKGAQFSVGFYQHKLNDKNKDGLIDGVEIQTEISIRNLTKGQYSYSLVFFNPVLNRGSAMKASQFLKHDNTPFFLRVDQNVNPKNYEELLQGDVDIKFVLHKSAEISEYGQKILMFHRWSPFFRTTTWDGYDSAFQLDFYGDGVVFDKKIGVMSFYPDSIQRKMIIPNKIIKDYGRDSDNDGLFDELVLALECDSIYEGPLYFQANLKSDPKVMFYGETKSGKGLGIVDLVFNVKELKEKNIEGVIVFENIVIANNSFQCPDGKCEIVNKPKLTVYLKAYQVESFVASDYK